MSTLSILLVDDDKPLRDAIAAELKKEGWAIHEAENGNAALELMRQVRVDVVLTDVRMPGGGGIELLERIRKSDTEKPAVIMMSGYSDLSEEEARRKGAAALLSKPFRGRDLIALIRKFAGQRRSEDDSRSVGRNR